MILRRKNRLNHRIFKQKVTCASAPTPQLSSPRKCEDSSTASGCKCCEQRRCGARLSTRATRAALEARARCRNDARSRHAGAPARRIGGRERLRAANLMLTQGETRLLIHAQAAEAQAAEQRRAEHAVDARGGPSDVLAATAWQCGAADTGVEQAGGVAAVYAARKLDQEVLLVGSEGERGLGVSRGGCAAVRWRGMLYRLYDSFDVS